MSLVLSVTYGPIGPPSYHPTFFSGISKIPMTRPHRSLEAHAPVHLRGYVTAHDHTIWCQEKDISLACCEGVNTFRYLESLGVDRQCDGQTTDRMALAK